VRKPSQLSTHKKTPLPKTKPQQVGDGRCAWVAELPATLPSLPAGRCAFVPLDCDASPDALSPTDAGACAAAKLARTVKSPDTFDLTTMCMSGEFWGCCVVFLCLLVLLALCGVRVRARALSLQNSHHLLELTLTSNPKHKKTPTPTTKNTVDACPGDELCAACVDRLSAVHERYAGSLAACNGSAAAVAAALRAARHDVAAVLAPIATAKRECSASVSRLTPYLNGSVLDPLDICRDGACVVS
jgi:hypothetical protein